jgi:hypothetical protein
MVDAVGEVVGCRVGRGGSFSSSPLRCPGSHQRPTSSGLVGSAMSTIMYNWWSLGLFGAKSGAPVEMWA